MICGNNFQEKPYFHYRSSYYITSFFQDADTEYEHDGSTRALWVSNTLAEILNEPHLNAQNPPAAMSRVIKTLMDPADFSNDADAKEEALSTLNAELNREGFEAFFGEDNLCYLRHIGTKTIVNSDNTPHRPFSKLETERRTSLSVYMNGCSEDELTEEILLPLFRQLGFHRITSAGHRDKALEYGKDLWMKYVLPTQHVLYFGIQAKKGKLDSSGKSHSGNANLAEIYHQALMMLGHEIFDPELNRRVLVDHAFIVAGGLITKAARNWLGGKLDQTKRSQIMFMDRDDILNLFVVSNIPLPSGALPKEPSSIWDDDVSF